MSAPLISVIVVCRNPGPRLRTALESIWNQTDAAAEIVVIDGASTDGTPAWLETQRSRLGAWVSEPDTGIYDAMNKGIAAARGEWVLFLGADDQMLHGTIKRVASVLRQTTAAVVVGEAIYQDRRVYTFRGTQRAVHRNFVHHQAAFYRRALFAQLGGFETRLRIMGDYEFNLRLLRAGVTFEPIAVRAAQCGSGGLSDAGHWTGYREEIAVRHRYFAGWRCWLWDLGSLVRYLRKQFLRPPSAHA